MTDRSHLTTKLINLKHKPVNVKTSYVQGIIAATVMDWMLFCHYVVWRNSVYGSTADNSQVESQEPNVNQQPELILRLLGMISLELA